MTFRQLIDPESFTYTYLVGDPQTGKAALIDPVWEHLERDLALISELGLTLTHSLETHLHADHVTSAAQLKDRTGCVLVSSTKGAPCADVKVKHGDRIQVGHLTLEVIETPGHTDDSISYFARDRVFTGDALCIRSAGRTDFQNGDPGQLYDSITERLFALPEDTLVYPAHDYQGRTVSTIGEEKRFNSRTSGRDRQAFVELMRGLKLPPPTKIKEALPRNRVCGRETSA